MIWASKLAVGLAVGWLIYFLFPGRHTVRPVAAAAVGVVGAALGTFLAQHILAIGGPGISPASLATAGAGALIFTLLYVGTSH
ncbi:hypothetical protein [Iodidimonas sp. SYSU 1G8]|uniref:hypothetical protein n=1 Tax=Iodidimonas sp. SYSU 1G8 TaxID=3133967 RepID=UPI0031FF1EB2